MPRRPPRSAPPSGGFWKVVLWNSSTSGPNVCVSAKYHWHSWGVPFIRSLTSTGILPSMLGMIVRFSPAPVIARI